MLKKKILKKRRREGLHRTQSKSQFHSIDCGQPVDKLSNKDMCNVLRSLKHDGDKKLPTRIAEMLILYKQQNHKKPLVFRYDDDSNDKQPETDDNANNESSLVVEMWEKSLRS